MQWLTLEYIKAHSRIEYDLEDSLLEKYANAAERMILHTLQRTYVNVIRTFDGIPDELFEVGLLLVELSVKEKAPVSVQKYNEIPYHNLEFILKPLMSLAEYGDSEYPDRALAGSDGLVIVGSDHKIIVCAEDEEEDEEEES